MPPVVDSRRLRVLKNLQLTLQGMTDPNVYWFPVDSNEQVTLDPTVNPLTGSISGKLFLIEPDPASDRQFWPAEQVTEEFLVNITVRLDAGAASANAKAETWERSAADLELALRKDESATPLDYTRGGLAVDTRLLAPSPFVGVGTNIVLYVQPVRIKIYRAYKDGT